MNSTSSQSPFRSDLTPTVHRSTKLCKSSCNQRKKSNKERERSRQDERLQDPSKTSPHPYSSSPHELWHSAPFKNRQSSLRLFAEVREEEDTWRSLRPESRLRRHRFRQIQDRQSVQRRERHFPIKINPVAKRGKRSHAREAPLSEGQEFR